MKQRSRVDPRLARSRAQYETSGLGLYQQTLARGKAQYINLPGVRKSVKSYFLIDLFPPSIIIENYDTAGHQSVPETLRCRDLGCGVVHI